MVSGPKRCTEAEDVVLLDKWATKGKGFLHRKSDLFPQKIGKRFNRCPLRAITSGFQKMVKYKRSIGHYSNSSRPLYEDGWEIGLFMIITNSLNNEILNVAQNLISGKVDIVFGGVESTARWAWQGYTGTTRSYFTRRIRWYVLWAFKHLRWNSTFRISSRQLWFHLMVSLAVVSLSVTLSARLEGVLDCGK